MIDLVKPLWTTTELSKNKLCSFNLNHKDFGKISADVLPVGTGSDFYTEIRNSFEQLIGTEYFHIDNIRKCIEGLSIKTNKFARKHGIGEIMRLISIMVMQKK